MIQMEVTAKQIEHSRQRGLVIPLSGLFKGFATENGVHPKKTGGFIPIFPA
jgi:hypothetical protein